MPQIMPSSTKSSSSSTITTDTLITNNILNTAQSVTPSSATSDSLSTTVMVGDYTLNMITSSPVSHPNEVSSVNNIAYNSISSTMTLLITTSEISSFMSPVVSSALPTKLTIASSSFEMNSKVSSGGGNALPVYGSIGGVAILIVIIIMVLLLLSLFMLYRKKKPRLTRRSGVRDIDNIIYNSTIGKLIHADYSSYKYNTGIINEEEVIMT